MWPPPEIRLLRERVPGEIRPLRARGLAEIYRFFKSSFPKELGLKASGEVTATEVCLNFPTRGSYRAFSNPLFYLVCKLSHIFLLILGVEDAVAFGVAAQGRFWALIIRLVFRLPIAHVSALTRPIYFILDFCCIDY